MSNECDMSIPVCPMEYPEPDMLSLFNKVGAKQMFAYEDENNVQQELKLGASGHVHMKTCMVESTGDSLYNSNMVVNGNGYFGNMTVFRTFPAGHTVSYCMRINDNEKLQFFKTDTRKEKSVLVNEMGIGAITSANKALTENISEKLDDLYDKAKLITKREGEPIIDEPETGGPTPPMPIEPIIDEPETGGPTPPMPIEPVLIVDPILVEPETGGPTPPMPIEPVLIVDPPVDPILIVDPPVEPVMSNPDPVPEP
uniref:Uncharacterized protein n=1 Tax=Pyramimonas orientalis virus TaxID=455367 RepID=A0A7M3UP83_POV01|nr:hypothetical protein HWQ62_00423 [Pyramimonas orientalis virus]